MCLMHYGAAIKTVEYSEHGQTFKMEQHFAKGTIPECRRLTRNVSGQERFCGTRGLIKISSKTQEKKTPHFLEFFLLDTLKTTF